MLRVCVACEGIEPYEVFAAAERLTASRNPNATEAEPKNGKTAFRIVMRNNVLSEKGWVRTLPAC